MCVAARTYGPRKAGAKEAFRLHAIEQRPKHRSADSHYGDTRFGEGPIRGGGAGVGKVSVVDIVDRCNAHDSNDDDTERSFVSHCLI